MTTESEPTDSTLLERALDVIERAIELAEDYDEEVQILVGQAAGAALSEEEKRSLFTRIVVVLHNGGVEPDGNERARIAHEVRAEVEALLAGEPTEGPVATAEPARRIELVPRNGHSPTPVKPTPIFKGRQVPMQEGFVDVTTIHLWKGNHRVELWVQEFKDREGRDPEDHELLAILHGDNVASGQRDDPFDIVPLAKSIAERGVDVAPILTWDGQPWDGNRRIAAAKYVLSRKGFTDEQRERARWVKVWVADDTTQDVVDDIVVAMNFEPDYRRPWEEYVKARLVVDKYKLKLEAHTAMRERITNALQTRVKQEVAAHYAIPVSRVTRYLEMVRWADDFEAYHVEERGIDEAKVRYKANDIFQYFFEIQAGRGDAVKLTTKLDQDDDLKAIVYDLMYDVMDSGAHVRALHKVVADEPSLRMLTQAHQVSQTDEKEAKGLVVAAIAEAAKNAPTKKVGFEQFVKAMVDRLGAAPPTQWEAIDTQTLRELRKVLPGVIGAIDGVLDDRDLSVHPVAE